MQVQRWEEGVRVFPFFDDGNTAVVVSSFNATFGEDNHTFGASGRYILLFRKFRNQWLLIAEQFSYFPQEPSGSTR
jgi:ketosteroid isomerase-like protein